MASLKIKQIRVRQHRSSIGRRKDQKRTLQALGLRRIGQSVVHNYTPAISGMVNKIAHLVTVDHIS